MGEALFKLLYDENFNIVGVEMTEAGIARNAQQVADEDGGLTDEAIQAIKDAHGEVVEKTISVSICHDDPDCWIVIDGIRICICCCSCE